MGTNKQNTTYKVSKDEIHQFYTLMNHGLQIPFMVEIVFKDAEAILEELNKGKKLQDVLFVGKEPYFKNIRVLSSVLSMKEAIACADILDQNTNGNINKVIKENLYPVFIFLFSFFMVLFFSTYIVPSMQIYAPSPSSFLFLTILKWAFEICIVCIGLFILYLVMLRRNNKILQISFIRQYNTIQFSVVFKALLENGLSTRKCIEVMSMMTSKESVSILAKELMSEFENGISIEQSIADSLYFDHRLLKFIIIGMQNSSLNSMLNLYVEQQRKSMEASIRKLSIGIQIVSYASVGFLVIVVYQIMLYPLNMLTSF